MTKPSSRDSFHFDGFAHPTTTPVPDVVFDQLLPQLREAELKALLYIIRRTFGFKKDHDAISFNQFLRGITTRAGRVLDTGCGIRDRTTLSRALTSLEAKGIIERDRASDARGEHLTTIYRLRVRESAPELARAGVGNAHHPGRDSPRPVVGNPDPQHTAHQHTVNTLSSHRSAPAEEGTDRDDPGHAPRGDTDVPTAAVTAAARHQVMPTMPRAPRPPMTAGYRGPTELRAVLATYRGGQTAPDGEDRPIIQAYLADFAREFGDRAALTASTARAYNLYRRAGLGREAFIAKLHEARSVTRDRSGPVRTAARGSSTGTPVRAKMAFYFAVLEDLLGLRARQMDDPTQASRHDGDASRTDPRTTTREHGT